MVNVRKEVSRIKRRLVLTKFFDCFLDSILISLLISLFLVFFGLSFLIAVGISGGYLVFGLIRSAKRSSISEIEKKIPGLEWQLRTAVDNFGKDNEIINDLNDEVAAKVGFVGFYDLISGKRTIKRFGGLVALGILLFYIQSSGFNILDTVEEFGGEGIGSPTGFFGGGEAKIGDLADVQGDGSLAELGGEEIELELGTVANEADLGSEGEYEKDVGGQNFDGKIGGSQDKSFNEDINLDEKSIVERFYNNLNK
ncbi:hypothetical protein HN992_03930 [Candidatus Woesearchaeota archaeon]|jgi:hypothetical protein|nr:hypothetical protein [Candidatus Woesearchaeota archaeon]MBT3438462.1 hypothetical protein [Candidatus Woesearchaeota archaeon]MBT4058355.1 hypothetical protein [Candidatus Woesearchaeota archaeon]MBT4731685.1 hypothetical protein [Candidatus Woesearchaeota archaeon]MBT4783012.1 hypothetical protein [Candidatus Woesearchaeota archaeon]